MVENSFINSVLNPFISIGDRMKDLLPSVGVAVVIIVVGYLLSSLVGFFVKLFLSKLEVDKNAKKFNLIRKDWHINISGLVGEIIKWYLFIIFLQVAVEMFDLGILSDLLYSFVFWLPNVIAAILIIFFAFGLSYFIEVKLHKHSKMRGIAYLANSLKVVIIVLASIVALTQIGIETSILENTFLILVGGFSLGIALALGLGFGLGFHRSRWLEKLKKK